jgi:hypothetical protein
MMSTPATLRPETQPTPRSSNFRVQNHGRVLAVVMSALLLLGFGVLRTLVDAGNTPHIETSSVTAPLELEPATTSATDEVHRLRPQTSDIIPTAGEQTLPREDESWNPLPIDWELESASSASENLDVARSEGSLQ